MLPGNHTENNQGQPNVENSFLCGIKQRLLSFIFRGIWNEERDDTLVGILAFILVWTIYYLHASCGSFPTLYMFQAVDDFLFFFEWGTLFKMSNFFNLFFTDVFVIVLVLLLHCFWALFFICVYYCVSTCMCTWNYISMQSIMAIQLHV